MAKFLRSNPDNYYRNTKRKLIKKIKKLQASAASGDNDQSKALANIRKLEEELETLQSRQKLIQIEKRRAASAKKLKVEKLHKVSGFNRIGATVISGGLPSLGKKK
jgi:hypothetical protein